MLELVTRLRGLDSQPDEVLFRLAAFGLGDSRGAVVDASFEPPDIAVELAEPLVRLGDEILSLAFHLGRVGRLFEPGRIGAWRVRLGVLRASTAPDGQEHAAKACPDDRTRSLRIRVSRHGGFAVDPESSSL
jgi:hypothetical protein